MNMLCSSLGRLIPGAGPLGSPIENSTGRSHAHRDFLLGQKQSLFAHGYDLYYGVNIYCIVLDTRAYPCRGTSSIFKEREDG